MFQAILAKIRDLAPIVPLTIAAILVTLAAPAYADGHHDKEGPFWFDKNGWTNLHFLAWRRDIDDPVVNLARAQDLLSRGANPNVVNDSGWTPLMNAAHTGFIKMASLLIVNGASVNVRNDIDLTAMDFAILNKHIEIQALLRAHGGRCNDRCP